MSDSFDLFEPQVLIPNDLRSPNVTLRPKKERRPYKKAVTVYQNANKHFATESVENVRANKYIRHSNGSDTSHGLSMRLDDEKGPSHASSRSSDGLPTNNYLFTNLKEKLELQRYRELKIDTDDPQFITDSIMGSVETVLNGFYQEVKEKSDCSTGD